jgi:FKBP-type peptidyl-prolyl cis-trans isomerase FkpA
MISSRFAACAAPRKSVTLRSIHILALFLALSAALLLALPVQAADPKIETDDEKTVYLIGVLMTKQLGMLNLSDAEMKIIIKALKDTHKGTEMELDPEEFGPKLRLFQEDRAKQGFAIEQKKSAAYTAERAKIDGAVVTDSGLIYTETKAGKGDKPSANSKVRVTYEGRLRDGSVFDARTAEFPLDGVIQCWGEGVAMIKVGGTATLVCPSDIAYGERGMPPVIPPGAALTFEIELIEILDSATE